MLISLYATIVQDVLCPMKAGARFVEMPAHGLLENVMVEEPQDVLELE